MTGGHDSDTAAARAARPGEGLLARFLDRAYRRDLLLLAAVPAVLVGVYSLPAPTRRAFALTYLDPTPATMFTSHYVHLEVLHLLANVLWFVSVAPLCYALSVLSDRRDQFVVVSVTFLLAFPFVLSALDVALATSAIGYGFSGLNMAFLGYLPVVLVQYSSLYFDVRLKLDHAPLLFFLTTLLLSLWLVPVAPPSAVPAGLALVGVLVYLRSLRRAGVTVSLPSGGPASQRQYALLGALALYLFVVLPFLAFPRDPTAGATATNLYTHFLGYCLGFITPYLTLRLVG